MMTLEEATGLIEDGEELVVFADTDSGATRIVTPTMKNTAVPPEVLKYVSRICWRLLNHSERIENISSMALADAHSVIEGFPVS